MNHTAIEYALNDDGTPGRCWNPVTGCYHNCSYCYARRFAHRFPDRYGPNFTPRFYPERLDDPFKLRDPSTILVCYMGDLFGSWVPHLWIEEIFKATNLNVHNRYLFLTKSPWRAAFYTSLFRKNMWIGTTLTGREDRYETLTRLTPLQSIKGCSDAKVFVSFEPLLWEPSLPGPLDWLDWIIIGAQTGPNARFPHGGWVQRILDGCIRKAPIFEKNNLYIPDCPDAPKIQQIPWLPTRKGSKLS